MGVKYRKGVVVVLSGILVVLAALGWLSYVGHGIAYGDLVGVRGRERDLAEVRRDAMRALGVAISAETLAVVLLWWHFSSVSKAAKLTIGLALALLADFLTYALVRGL
jgi:hypothetical protein